MASGSERGCGGRSVIPRAHITGWRSQAPWPTDAQVEQDLVLTRALTEIFMRLKIEINSREHFSVLGLQKQQLIVESPWYSDTADITVYALEELLGTKLRALYQRKKGRDLYDLWRVLDAEKLNNDSIIKCFQRYLAHGELTVSRAQFEENLTDKMQDDAFLEDVEPLLPTGVKYQAQTAYNLVSSRLIARLPGDPWKGSIP
jgi:hypothetical protein